VRSLPSGARFRAFGAFLASSATWRT